MCKFRSYKHSCGHVTHRPQSTCRFTYCSTGPGGDKALCRAGPELVVGVPDACRSCEYHSFCSTWEAKIADARAKQSAARSMIREIQQQDSSSYFDCTLSWGGGAGLGYNDGTDVEEYGIKPRPNLARHNQNTTDGEIDSLWQQYQREQMEQWRIFVSGPSNNSESPERRSWRRRRPSTRCSGDSPLKQVVSADEVPDLKITIPNNSAPEEEYDGDASSAEDWGGEDPFSDDGDVSPTTTKDMPFKHERSDSNSSDSDSAIESDDEEDMAEFLSHEGDVNDDDSDETEDPASPKTPPRSAELPGPDWSKWNWPSKDGKAAGLGQGDDALFAESLAGLASVGESLGVQHTEHMRRGGLRRSLGGSLIVAPDEAVPDLALPDWGMA